MLTNKTQALEDTENTLQLIEEEQSNKVSFDSLNDDIRSVDNQIISRNELTEELNSIDRAIKIDICKRL